MSLQKTFALFTLFLTTLVVFGLSFIISNPQTVSAADCEIVSAQFMSGTAGSHGAGWYSENLRRLIPMQIVTNNCEGQEIEVSLSQINENTGALLNPVDALDREPFTVPNSNKVDIYAWNGDENCAPLSGTCTYAINVHDPAGQGFTSYNAANGTLSYPCDGSCLAGPDWELVANNNSDGGLCNITSATMSPSGIQPANFYKDDARPLVDISIQTQNCVAQTIQLSLTYQANNDIDTDVPLINNREITVPTSGSVTVKTVAGEDKCIRATSNEDLCTYYLSIWNPADIKFIFENKTGGSISYYMCENPDDHFVCPYGEQTKWSIQQHSGINPETGETVFEEALPGPTLTEGAPCVLGTGDDLSFDEDCYALLAPIGDLKEIKGDITLGSYINILVSILIGLAGLLAVVMIVVGGIQYMTTDALAGKSNARETITKALLGLILALGSYLILKTINPQLLIVEPNIPDIYYGVDGPPELNSNGTYQTQDPTMQNITQGTSWEEVKNSQGLYDIRSELTWNVGVNNPECETVGQSGCTSLYFTPAVGQSILNKLEALGQACADPEGNPCGIVITGGSEFWAHRTHGPSREVLDFSVRHQNHTLIELEDVLLLNTTLSGESSPVADETYTNFPGFTALYEVSGVTPHWHVFD